MMLVIGGCAAVWYVASGVLCVALIDLHKEVDADPNALQQIEWLADDGFFDGDEAECRAFFMKGFRVYAAATWPKTLYRFLSRKNASRSR